MLKLKDHRIIGLSVLMILGLAITGISMATLQQNTNSKIKLTKLPANVQKILPGISRERLVYDLGTKLATGAFLNSSKQTSDANKNLERVRSIMKVLLLDSSIASDFDTPGTNNAKNEAFALGYLIADGHSGVKIAGEISRLYGKRTTAFFEFAIKSFIAVRLHVPGMDLSDSPSDAAVKALERAAETAGIPRELYGDFVKKLKDRESSHREIVDQYMSSSKAILKALRF